MLCKSDIYSFVILQEIKQLKRAYQDASSAALVDVQCQLADRSHELILGELLMFICAWKFLLCTTVFSLECCLDVRNLLL